MTAEMGKEDTEAEFCRHIEDRTGIEDRTAAEYEGCLSMQQYSWLLGSTLVSGSFAQ